MGGRQGAYHKMSARSVKPRLIRLQNSIGLRRPSTALRFLDHVALGGWPTTENYRPRLLAEKIVGQGNERGVECIHMPDASPLFWGGSARIRQYRADRRCALTLPGRFAIQLVPRLRQGAHGKLPVRVGRV